MNERLVQTLETTARFREYSTRIRTFFQKSDVDIKDFFERFCSVPYPSGLVVLSGALNLETQLSLARQSIDEYAFYPHNNLSALGKHSQPLSRYDHLKHIRWSCLGYNYDWTNRIYKEGWKSDFPKYLADLSLDLLNLAGYTEGYRPEAAIVNFYNPNQKMGPHRDDAEFTMDKPIVSISLGCDAIFCIETKPFSADSNFSSVYIRSGDVVVMGGESRSALHCVPMIFDNTFELTEDDDETIQFLNKKRININVRQVHA